MSAKITKDGRTILTGKDYTAMRVRLHAQQRSRCCVLECMRYTNVEADQSYDFSFHVSHRETRGIGGSLRDDVVGPKKGQIEGGKCGFCHRKEHETKNKGK